MQPRLVLLQQRGPPGVTRRLGFRGIGSTPTAALPPLTSAIACAGLRCTCSGVSAPKCSRAAWVKPASESLSHTATVNGPCIAVVPASSSRQMRTTACAGSRRRDDAADGG